MATPGQYDPLSVTITWGSINFLALAEGTFIEVKRDQPSYTKKVGSTGSVARVKNRNKAGTAKVVLMLTSVTNAKLSTIHALGEDGPTTADMFPFMVKDLLNNTLVHCANAWIQKVADVTYGNDLPGREWMFDFDSVKMRVGDGDAE